MIVRVNDRSHLRTEGAIVLAGPCVNIRHSWFEVIFVRNRNIQGTSLTNDIYAWRVETPKGQSIDGAESNFTSSPSCTDRHVKFEKLFTSS